MTTLLDGGTGTELRMRGIEVPSHITSIWSARALFTDPDAVVRVHADYIAAGADVITANNYAVTPPLLAREGIEDRLEELTLQAVELACRARDASGRPVRIAGSLPPLDTSYRADLVGEDEVLRADYIRFARARGLTDKAVNFHHALKNTLVPVITVTGLQLGSIIAFAIITETVFQWPGVGLLFINAIQFVDIPVMAAYLMLISVMFVAINLIVDLLYYAIDPRLRIEGRHS